jgi:malonate-semialdehyde dehydrogenase (acetylating) / methylmalonate-semialdehyde dehydrogenase
VTAAAKENILRLVESGIEQGAELVVDGRNFNLQGYEDGFFVGPHLFDRVTAIWTSTKRKSLALSCRRARANL